MCFVPRGISVVAVAVSPFSVTKPSDNREQGPLISATDFPKRSPSARCAGLFSAPVPSSPPAINLHRDGPADRSDRSRLWPVKCGPAGGGGLVGCQTVTCWAPPNEKGLSPLGATSQNRYVLPEERPCHLGKRGAGPRAERVIGGQAVSPAAA